MSDELTERVARAMCASVEARTSDVNVVRALGYDSVQAFIDAAWPNYAPEATAAIAAARPSIRRAALEEAAKVADGCDDGSAFEGALTASFIAKTIRALIGKEPV